MSDYSIKKITNYTFDEAIEKTKAALSNNGFGVLTEINVKETLKKKLDVEHEDYIILGACNPKMAYSALQTEKEIGLMLPCNVIVYSTQDGVVVSAIKPLAALGVAANEDLDAIANKVENLLEKVIKEV